jgi:hypothetical protein
MGSDLRIGTIAVGSVEARIAPRRAPSAQERFRIYLASSIVREAERTTPSVDRRLMLRRCFRRVLNEVSRPASKRIKEAPIDKTTGVQSPSLEERSPSPDGPMATPRPRKNRMSGSLNSSAKRDKTSATIRKIVAVKNSPCVEIMLSAPSGKHQPIEKES